MGLFDSVQGLINNTGLTGIQRFFKTGENKTPPDVNVRRSNGQLMAKESRVHIKVPPSYIAGVYTNRQPNISKGIIFPYTPQISFEHKAEYTSSKTMHSNFQQQFYQNSSVGSISITGKFTVQNDDDAEIYLSTIHLLRSLTKMQTANDAFPGSPPPVCRLFAYGDYMLNNVPVTVASFRSDLPDNVDYYATGGKFNGTMVPMMSTIVVNLLPMYSRAEQQKFSVKGWLAGDLNKDGYL
jgi:hypothetical protein